MQTLDKILKNFNKSIVQLRKLSEYSTSEADTLTRTAEECTRKAEVETKTATQANKIADNIEKLIAPE